LPGRGTAPHLKGEVQVISEIAAPLGDQAHSVARTGEMVGQDARNCFNPADVWIETV